MVVVERRQMAAMAETAALAVKPLQEAISTTTAEAEAAVAMAEAAVVVQEAYTTQAEVAVVVVDTKNMVLLQ